MVVSLFSKLVKQLLLILILVVMIFPLLWMFLISLMEPGSSLSFSNLLEANYTLQNFSDLLNDYKIGHYLFNSIFVGLTVTIGNILFCFMVAYTLARYKSLPNKLIFISIIVVLMIPAHIVIIPLYVLFMKSGMYDSYYALILPFLVSPIGIFLVKQYIETIPTSMEEAARIDGASELTILFKIVMPLCKPALAVLSIQVFFTNWNSFLFPYILTQSDSVRTLPVALAHFQGFQGIDWQHLMAGSVIAVLPVLILFIVLQRQIVSGITAGAIKQ